MLTRAAREMLRGIANQLVRPASYPHSRRRMLISRRQDPVSKDLSKAPVADALKALEDVVGVRRVICAVPLFDSDDARGFGSELC